MSLRSTSVDGVQVYTVTGSKSVPRWVSDRKESKKKRNEEDQRKRIDLVQDLEFPASCGRIKKTSDGEFLMACGTHAPQVRAYELSQLSMKFSRHLDAEVVDFQILSDDYSKVAMLCQDRSVCFHAKFGAYYKTRIPKHGRDLAYASDTCDLVVASSSSEIYRLNLEQGRFLAPLESISPAVNAIGISQAHGMLACAGEDGILECFDLRERRSVGSLNVGVASGIDGVGLSAVRFNHTGLELAAGTVDGKVLVYDLRSSRPMVTKDHKYDSAIIDLKFHDGGGSGSMGSFVISSDKYAVRIWDKQSGKPFTTIESQVADLNDICVWDRKGLILLATEAPQVQAYFIPALGPAPSWCSFLEGLTEELEEEDAPQAYDDYKFVTKEELDRLGLGHMVGTSLLKAYMHGFFMDIRLYHKAKSIVEPFAYDRYRQERIKQKMEEERKTRIRARRKLPKVNAEVAAKIIAEAEEKGNKDAEKSGLLGDERFAKMFENKDFAIDEDADDYKLLHPNAASKKQSRHLIDEHFDVVDVDASPGTESEDAGIEEENERISGRVREPRMFEAKDERAAMAFRERKSIASIRAMPLGQLAEALNRVEAGHSKGSVTRGGGKEMTFVPKSSAKIQKSRKRDIKLPGETLPAGGAPPSGKRRTK